MRKDFGRFIAPAAGVFALLGLQAWITASVHPRDDAPAATFERIPAHTGMWKQVRALPLEQAVVEYLKPDSHIHREYSRLGGGETVALLAVHYRSTRNGAGPHSPKHCLPGSGWSMRDEPAVITAAAGTTSIRVNEYTMRRGSQEILVRYWYQNSRRTWTAEAMAKVHLLTDLFQYQRSDAALVRVIASVGPASRNQVRSSLNDFIHDFYPLLSQQMPQ